MGKVYVGATEVGTFEPQEVGQTGDVWLDAEDVGDFNFTTPSGNVYLESDIVGTYGNLGYPAQALGFIQPSVIAPKVVGGG